MEVFEECESYLEIEDVGDRLVVGLVDGECGDIVLEFFVSAF